MNECSVKVMPNLVTLTSALAALGRYVHSLPSSKKVGYNTRVS